MIEAISLRRVDKEKQRRGQTYHNHSRIRVLKKNNAANFRAINLRTFGFRRERCIVWGGNMKYVRRSIGQASADPIGACERHCEKIDAGELAPPKLRALGPRNLDLGMKKDETETSLSNQGSQIRALPWAARPIQVS